MAIAPGADQPSASDRFTRFLTNTCLLLDRAVAYGKCGLRDGGPHDPSKIALAPVPVLIDTITAERVLANLPQNKSEGHAAAGHPRPVVTHGIVVCVSVVRA